MRFMILAAVAALALTSTVTAKTCKDPKTGKFGACAAAAQAKVTLRPASASPATSAMARCKDAKGHFIACSATATRPAMAAAAPGRMMASKPAGSPRMGPEKCKTGVPCGNSCISKGKICHKS